MIFFYASHITSHIWYNIVTRKECKYEDQSTRRCRCRLCACSFGYRGTMRRNYQEGDAVQASSCGRFDLLLAASEVVARVDMLGAMSEETLIFTCWFGGMGLVIGCILAWFLYSAARNRKLDQMADANHKRWRAEIAAAGGDLPVREVPIRLKKGEVCFFYDPTATLCEPRAVRSGGYGGTSIRVARGVSIHTGRFGSESHDEWRKITEGALYVTNRRIIFDGALKNRVISIADVLSIAPGARAAVVNSQKLQKPLAFASINGQIFADVVNTIIG